MVAVNYFNTRIMIFKLKYARLIIPNVYKVFPTIFKNGIHYIIWFKIYAVIKCILEQSVYKLGKQ